MSHYQLNQTKFLSKLRGHDQGQFGRRVFFLFVLTILVAAFVFGSRARAETTPVSDLIKKGCLDKEGLNGKLACWNDLVARSLDSSGLDQSYRDFTYLYSHDPGFAANCHEVAHKLGSHAYRKYIQTKQIALDQGTAYCGYGFYHGFMELFLRNGQTVLDAQKFCEVATKQLKANKPSIRRQCYHGIGHGSLDIDNETLRKNTENLLSAAEQRCLKMSESSEIRQVCGTGVYNAFLVSYSDPKYQLYLDFEHPFQICANRQSYFVAACYANISGVVAKKLGKDFQSTAAEISKIENPKNRSYSFAYLSYLLAPDVVEGRSQVAIDKCRSLDKENSLMCLTYIPMGLVTQGEPGHEKDLVLGFCSLSSLSEAEKEPCFKMAFDQLSGVYAKDKWPQLCSTVDSRYRKYCVYSE